MPKKRMSTPEATDRLFRYKAQLEANTSRPWTWLEVADAMNMDPKTLRTARYDPDTTNVATLRKIEDFLQGKGVAFSVSQYLVEQPSSLVPA